MRLDFGEQIGDRIMRPRIKITIETPDGPQDAPESVYRLVEEALPIVAEGHAAAVIAVDDALTTSQAAEILGVSRPHVVKLIEDGALPSYNVGKHRRIEVRDLLRFKRERDSMRERALADLTSQSEDLELY